MKGQRNVLVSGGSRQLRDGEEIRIRRADLGVSKCQCEVIPVFQRARAEGESATGVGAR